MNFNYDLLIVVDRFTFILICVRYVNILQFSYKKKISKEIPVEAINYISSKKKLNWRSKKKRFEIATIIRK